MNEDGTDAKVGLLIRPEGVFNHYRIHENFSLDSASRMRNVDLGFNMFTELLLSGSAFEFNNGTIVKSFCFKKYAESTIARGM